MIRINLLKKKTPGKKNQSVVRIIRWGVIVCIGAVILTAGITGGRKLIRQMRSAKKQPVVQKPPSSYKPSTYNRADIVEDVVREISTERAAGRKTRSLDLPYNDLSFIEKVNYEVLYGKNVFALLSRAVPSGIGLKSLEIDNFQTIYAVGLGTSRELVSSTFSALKAEKLELLPQPFSYITSNNGDGYRFVVTCKTLFGLDLTDPFQASDHLPARADLPLLTKKIKRMGSDEGITFREGPIQLNAEKIGAFRRFHYRYRATSTYNDFVKFLLSLHSNKIPCAFKKVDIKARSGSVVDIEAQVIFTVRE